MKMIFYVNVIKLTVLFQEIHNTESIFDNFIIENIMKKGIFGAKPSSTKLLGQLWLIDD